METVTLSIDGLEVQAKQGATVLEAAQGTGIYIPTLCHHPNLTPFGACRLCVVEIERMRGFPTACTTPATDGMIVRTNTPQLNELRRNIMELLISEHPNRCLTCHRLKHCPPNGICLRDSVVTDRCVTCAKNGRCELQSVCDFLNMADYMRYVRIERAYTPGEQFNPLITRDYEKCILCGRCVRACQDLRGVGTLAFTYRSGKARIGTAFGLPDRDAGCRFCFACSEVCPTATMMDRAEMWQPVPDREAHVVPCVDACPARVDVPRYIRLINERKYAEAYAVVRERYPFVSICGLVCFHPCEAACRRGQLDEPIAIRALKRFAAEQAARIKESVAVPPSGKRVAVVGAGPAGLTAAYYLAKRGHAVTVFEALPEPGGMMRVGIPAYRLPRDVLDAEIDLVRAVGVEIRTNTQISSLEELFDQGFNAVFLAIGAHQGLTMGVEGEEGPGVMECVTFLREVSLGKEVSVGDKVAVVGGGNAAIDAARTSLRLGAKEVAIIYRRTRAEMPAAEEEVEEALHEGVNIQYLAAPTRITRGNGTVKLECLRMQLGEVDASGRRRPEPIPGSEFVVDVDTVIAAIGQMPEVPAQLGLPTDRGNRLRVASDSLATGKAGVYAGGDAVTGPASVIEAIAAGKQAAISIDRYLGGSGDITETVAPLEKVSPCLVYDETFGYRQRPKVPSLPIDQRLNGFVEVELGFAEETAADEAKRCLQCDLRLQISPVMLPPTEVVPASQGRGGDGSR